MAKFDLAKTEELTRLFAVPRESRGPDWLDRFFAAVPDASLAAPQQQVRNGPDGFPYFQLGIPEPYVAFDAFCVTHVLDVCLANGFGCVVNNGPVTEWVFRYGNLWSYRELGRFETPPPERPPPGGQALVASPSDSALPKYARPVLRKQLEAAGVAAPGVLFVDQDGAKSVAVNTTPELFPTEDDYHRFMQSLTWYLPPQYGLMAIPTGAGWPDPMPL